MISLEDFKRRKYKKPSYTAGVGPCSRFICFHFITFLIKPFLSLNDVNVFSR